MNIKLMTVLLAGTLAGVPAQARLSLAEARALGRTTDPMIRQTPRQNSLPVITPGISMMPTEMTLSPSLPAACSPKAPAKRLSAKGSAIYGYLGYADEYRFVPAMCVLDGHAFTRTWEDPRYLSDEAIMTAGWLKGDRIYGVSTISFMGQTLASFNVECDLTSGQTVLFQELPDGTPTFSIAAYDKSDETLYGIWYHDSKYFFSKAPVDSPNSLTEICEAPERLHLISMAYRDDDKSIYGVNMAGEFVKVGHDGSATVLKQFVVPKEIAGYYTGLVYVPADREFIWNVNYSDYTASLFSIDAETYDLTEIDPCPSSEQYIFMSCLDGAYDGQAPCRPQAGSIDFPKGALSGSVSFVLPSELQDGSPLTGDIAYTITFDSEDYTSGTGRPGETVKADFSGITQGYHTFGIKASASGHEAPMQLVSAYLGQDIPLAPTDVQLTKEGLVSWKAVTEGVNGGYVDVAGMRYHVMLDGDEVAETGDTSVTIDLPVDQPLAAYSVTVTAEYDNLWSMETESNFVVAGTALEMPVSLTPTREQMMLFTTCEENGSGNIWRYDSGDVSMKMILNGKEADAWLFTPLIHIPSSDCYYTLTFDASSMRESDGDDLLAVYIGKTDEPDVMTIVGETFTPKAPGYESYERLIKVDEPGDYVIAFRATSPADAYGVAVKNILLEDGGVTPDSPARPTGLSATPAARGELKARVDFTFPSTDVAGNPLPSDARLRAIVAGTNKVVANGRPGESAYANVNTVQGDNRLSVTVSLDDKNSPVAYVNAYTGVVLPESVSAVAYMQGDDMMSISLMWAPVTKGVNGGYVDASDITYTVFLYEETPYSSTWIPVAEGVTGNTYTYDLPADAPQGMVRLGICAVNAAGRSENMAIASAVAGKTWDLPMKDNFAEAGDDGAAYFPYINYRPDASYNSSFIFVTPEDLGSEFNEETGFYFAAGGSNGSKARLGLPVFNTKDGRAQIEFTALCGGGFAPLSLYVDCGSYNGPQYLGTMPEEGGLQTRTFLLPESSSRQGWVQIFVDGTIENSDMLAFRGYEVSYATGVETPADSRIAVKGAKGSVEVSGAAGECVSVFALDGTVAARVEKASDYESFRLPAGIYLVKAGSKAVKAVVF